MQVRAEPAIFRTKFRKRMNEADNRAATRLVDALVNFEAVKVGTSRGDVSSNRIISFLPVLHKRAL